MIFIMDNDTHENNLNKKTTNIHAVVVLLILEYVIAVDSRPIYGKTDGHATDDIQDIPFAERLDRSYLGFDQDYFERMPLLVNALQDSKDVILSLETTTLYPKKEKLVQTNSNLPKSLADFNYKTGPIRRTSPRPFIFDYKSPSPSPFSKTYGSRTWVEGYRNAERLKNLQQVIKYLEKTINAKFGDIYVTPKSTQIAFSGVYIEPMISDNSENFKSKQPTDLIKPLKNTNHLSDPFFNFKPESPGEVNLLADGFLRFSPATKIDLVPATSLEMPMFRPIPYYKRKCFETKCNENLREIQKSQTFPTNEPKSFSVMLNLFSVNQNHDAIANKHSLTRKSPVDKIYITTPRPLIQFKRRSYISKNSNYISNRPINFRNAKSKDDTIHKGIHLDKKTQKNTLDTETKLLVHVHIYPGANTSKTSNSSNNNSEFYSSTTQTSANKHITYPSGVIVAKVEDHHVGSSGIVPVEFKQTTLPVVTTIFPFFEETVMSSDNATWSSTPLEIMKFSHEDAKIPDQYRKLLEDKNPGIDRQHLTGISAIKNKITDNKTTNEDEETKTLLRELENILETSTKTIYAGTSETTTSNTYVPRTNGHYRQISQNSRSDSTWFEKNLDNYRKKRLEMQVKNYRKPQYVEIKRNNTMKPNSEIVD